MKKINRNMRGFTLVEIMIVVAIILIISAAAFTGVAVTLSNAQDKQDEVQDHAENFEEAARTEIRSLTVGVVDWTTIPKYTPRKKADREVAALKAFGWKDEEIEVTYGETGYVITKTWNPDLHDGKTYEEYLEEYNAAHNKNTTSNTNTPATPATPNANDPVSDPVVDPVDPVVVDPVVPPTTGIQSGVLSSSTSTSPVKFNYYQQTSLSFDSSVKNANTVTVVYKVSGAAVTSVENWGHIGSGKPDIKISGDTVTLTFNVKGMEQWQKDNLMNNSPQFHSNGETTVTIDSVSTT